MVDRRQCEFFLLRYVPDAVRDEFVNVGVVVFDQASGWADVQFTRDWRRVRCLDPEVDVEMLEGMEREIRERLSEGAESRDWLLHRMQDTFSNALQLTPAKAVLTESPQAEIGRLAEIYLERRRRAVREASGRQQVYATMRQEFDRQGVWKLMRHNIAASEYTHKGDPLKIDCGYRPNGTVHLYHAVSLTTEVNSVKVLAFSYPMLREGVERTEKAQTTLTAVVEAGLNRKEDDSVAFAMDTLLASGIVIASADELPRIAENVRREMRI